MIRLNLLTEPPRNQNTAAFLGPIIWNQKILRDRGIVVRTFYGSDPALGDCDVFAVNSKFWGGDWQANREPALALLKSMYANRRVLYFDRSSTPGSVNRDVLPHVHRYLKNAVYRERGNYTREVYNGRLFADYYHRAADVTDYAPLASPALSEAEAARIEVSWNTGLANYSLTGPRRWSWYRFLPFRALMAPPRQFIPPSGQRTVAVSCRMGSSYRHATVAHQRLRMAELLARYRTTRRVSKMAYVRELCASKIVASPFGYSEINYKDFEAFLCGAVLFKPDMSHLDTWPDYFRPDATYVAHRWDLSDVAAKIEEVLGNYDHYLEIARAGQSMYRWHTAERAGQEAFADRFATLVGPP